MSGCAKTMDVKSRSQRSGISFGLREWSGAFGDIGTDLPLLAGMLMVSGMPPVRVLIVFGVLQMASGWIYRIPMAIQPLKAVAVLVIAQGISYNIIVGSGLAIGLAMLVLTLSGGLQALARLIPGSVVRGIQFGLGLKLCLLALQQYVGGQGWEGWLLALAAAALMLSLAGQTRVPVGVLLIVLGAGAVLWGGVPFSTKWTVSGIADSWRIPLPSDVWTGFLLLALPQIPLSLGNSILATQQLAEDWFPERGITVRKIGMGYSLFNIVAALVGGVPVCHGSGGLAGHYALGGRTGGSVILYGAFYLGLGLAISLGAHNVLAFFPLPILGVILAREGFVLMARLKTLADDPLGWKVAVLVGILAAAVPNGFVIGTIAGTVLTAAARRMTAVSTVVSVAGTQSE
ncbi:MAG TPA: putative sulfate/molybdate transporter [Candidatus Hydrogenedentes bacterium]|nr:putative sulfate/molybdate transporter [Candidatus Hydrogenedentota bacterium]